MARIADATYMMAHHQQHLHKRLVRLCGDSPTEVLFDLPVSIDGIAAEDLVELVCVLKGIGLRGWTIRSYERQGLAEQACKAIEERRSCEYD